MSAAGQWIKCMRTIRVHTGESLWGLCIVHVFTKRTCSCDPSGSPAARRPPWPGPVVRKSGNTLAVCPTGWPRHLARRTHSPSTSSMPPFPGEMGQTGRHPAGSLSPGLRWLQTSWQRRWAALFATEAETREGGRGRAKQRRMR